jgi:hypothetical protein
MRDVDFWKGLYASTLRENEKTKVLINKLQDHIGRLSPGNKKVTARNMKFRDRLRSQLARADRRNLALNARLAYYNKQIQSLQGMSRLERVIRFPVI